MKINFLLKELYKIINLRRELRSVYEILEGEILKSNSFLKTNPAVLPGFLNI